eukprot:scaffold2385_cov272-Prasinococcus_capsulatus_cf.AAC.3
MHSIHSGRRLPGPELLATAAAAGGGGPRRPPSLGAGRRGRAIRAPTAGSGRRPGPRRFL